MVFAICFPFRFKVVYNRKGNAAKILGIVNVFSICDQWHQFGFLKAKPSHEVDLQADFSDITKYCDPQIESISGYLGMRGLITAVCNMIIPSAIMIVSSVLIVLKVYFKRKTQVHVKNDSLEVPEANKKKGKRPFSFF